MEEQKLKERELMNEEEYKDYLSKITKENEDNGMLHLHSLAAVNKFKSIRRAIRRGLASQYGDVYPKRPYNNRANTSKRKGHTSRVLNEAKKEIYGQLYK